MCDDQIIFASNFHQFKGIIVSNRYRVFSTLGVALGMVVGSAGMVFAHRLLLNYEPIAEIEIQATYDSGEAMAGGQVLIYKPDNPQEPIMQGLTDDQGRFRFQPDANSPGYWQVQVRQAGHGANLNILVAPETPTELSATPLPNSPESPTGQQPLVKSLTPTGVYTPLQLAIMVAAIFWGSFGTACFFWSKKENIS